MKVYKRIVIFSLVASFFVGCDNQPSEAIKLVRKVKVDKVESVSAKEYAEFAGVVKEARSVNLSFRVAGPIKRLKVKQGDHVQKGDLVAEIDTRDYELQLSVAQAEFDKVTAETKRVIELYNRQSVTEADYQKAVAGEKMITAQLNRAKDQLNDTKLYAPFTGFIQSLNFEQGEIVNIGMPIAELLDVESFQVEVDIPAELFVSKKRFEKVSCHTSLVNSTELPLELVNYQAKANASRLYRLFYRLNPNADKRIAPGMEVLVTIEYSKDSETGLVVPITAVFNDEGRAYVWVYNATDSIVIKRNVTTGALHGKGKIKIVAGLSGSETVVVAGVNVLNDNEKVEIVKPVSETNIGGIL